MGMKIPGISSSGIPPEYVMARHEGVPSADLHAGTDRSREPAYTPEDIQRSAKILEQTFRLFNKRLKFSVNEEIDRVIVKVIDGTTDKVIKEIPPEEIQRLIARIKETIGLLFDQKI